MSKRFTQVKVPGLPKNITGNESYTDIQLRDDTNKHWAIATVHEMAGCSDPRRDISLTEAEYYATLFQHAPELLELLTELVVKSATISTFDTRHAIHNARSLCKKLIALKLEVPLRQDRFEIGDVTTMSQEALDEMTISLGYERRIISNSDSSLKVIDIIDNDTSPQTYPHPQLVEVIDNNNTKTVLSGYWLKPVNKN